MLLSHSTTTKVVSTNRFFLQVCKACNKRCFPEDPSAAVQSENAAAHVERVYCSHCYHHDCLILYMKSPPFNGKFYNRS